MTAVRTRVIEGFDDPTFGPERWERLLHDSNTDIVYLTWHWQRTWWETYGQGDLLLITAERSGRVVALAPMYARSGIVYFVGAAHWQADNLDFIGDVSDPDILDAILLAARNLVREFQGFRLEFVRDSSRTGRLLRAAAERLALSCFDEWDEAVSTVDLTQPSDGALSVMRGKSVLKRERFFQRNGGLEIQHLRDGKAIYPNLEELFAQHIIRFDGTALRSFFHSPRHRIFYERLTDAASETGWVRFARLLWDGRPIAFHYGYCYRGRYVWNLPTFAIDLAHRSPGQVLQRHLLLSAIEEGAHTFDLGAGDQPFKLQVATATTRAHGFGLYPSARLRRAGQGDQCSLVGGMSDRR